MKELTILFLGLFVGLAQIVAGVQGIHFHFGGFLAFLSLVSLFFGFSLPITIAAFFGATDVWGWHWLPSILLVVPGLLFIVPGTALQFFESLKNANPNTEKAPSKQKLEEKKISNFTILINWVGICILVFIIFTQSFSKPNQSSPSQASQQNYSQAEKNNSISLEEIAKRQQQEIDKRNNQQHKTIFQRIYQKITFDGVDYNINTDSGTVYLTTPYLDSTGYIVKFRVPNVDGYGIVAMTPTNCKVYNKRINGESNLNPQLYLNGQLKYVFDSFNGINGVSLANYICNYSD